MNHKIPHFILLILAFLLAGCYNALPDTDDEFPYTLSDHYGTYIYDECVYLGAWFSISMNYYTEMRQGLTAIVLSEKYQYNEVSIKHDLDKMSFAFSLNNSLDEQKLVKRYDIYTNDLFTGRCVYVDNEQTLYLASLEKLGESTLYSVCDIWHISPYEDDHAIYLLHSEDKPRLTTEEFLGLIPALETIQQHYVDDINDVISELDEALPMEKMAAFLSGLFGLWFIIGDNMIFRCYEYPSTLTFQLSYYENDQLVWTINDVGKFSEFMNRSFDD